MVLAFFRSPGFVRLAEAEGRAIRAEAELARERIHTKVLEDRAQAFRPGKGRSPPVWTFRVRGWEWVEMTIYPRDLPAGKTIRALRIYVPLEDQPDGPGYWDITRKRAQAMIEPLLPGMVGTDDVLVLRQVGKGYRSFDSLSFHPAQIARKRGLIP